MRRGPLAEPVPAGRHAHAFRDGSIPATGTAITKILPPASGFSAGGGHGEKKQRVLSRLGDFFERFFGLLAGGSE